MFLSRAYESQGGGATRASESANVICSTRVRRRTRPVYANGMPGSLRRRLVRAMKARGAVVGLCVAVSLGLTGGGAAIAMHEPDSVQSTTHVSARGVPKPPVRPPIAGPKRLAPRPLLRVPPVAPPFGSGGCRGGRSPMVWQPSGCKPASSSSAAQGSYGSTLMRHCRAWHRRDTSRAPRSSYRLVVTLKTTTLLKFIPSIWTP